MAKQLNVALNFTAETGQAKAAIQELQQSLSKIAYAGTGNIVGNSTQQIKEASEAAKQLQYHLNNAYNATTGNFDLSRLDKSLQSSKTNIADLSAKLLGAGQTGQQAFAQLAQSISMADQPMFRINNKLSEMLTTLKNTARWQISSSILHGFMGTLQYAYGYAQDLNESLNNIRIVTGQSVDQMARFAEQANKSAKALSTTTTEYTNASLIYYQQGLTDAEVQERTDVTIKMANASGQSAQIVSDQMTAVWNNFDNGSKSLEYYADVMTALGAATASSTDEIAAGLEKFAAVSETVGLSYEYATAALATVTATTRQSADVVGNAFKTLFARIQGLNLGETLDDGTTLNKYSQALEKVGISIFEQNGQMKEMDDILDEMGAKWDTLDKSQQTALAQTVAGVRQYTQLIALMDNWDYFKENLGVAYGAEGELNKQAEIYAESWEAARDRVAAAAESIYQNLLDDKFFITINNGFADLLTGIGEFIKGIGGAKGVITMFASVMLSNFAHKIPEAIQNLQYNLTLLTRGSAQAYKKIQADMVASTEKAFSGQLGSTISKDSAMGFSIDSANKLAAARLKLSMVSSKMTDAEKQLAQMELSLAQSQQQEIISIKQKNEALMEEINLTQKAIESGEALNTERIRDKAFKAEDSMMSRRSEYTQKSPVLKSLDAFHREYSILLDNLETNIQTKIGKPLMEAFTKGLQSGSFQDVTINLDNIANRVDSIKRALNIKGVGIEEARARISELTALLPNSIKQSQELRRALDDIKMAGDKGKMQIALDNLKTVLTNCKIPANDLKRILSEIYGNDKIESLTSKMNKYSEGVNKAEKLTKSLNQALNDFQPKHITSSIERVSALAGGLGQVAMAANSVKSIFNAWNNEDLSFGEKLLTSFTGLSMLLPSIGGAFKSFNTATNGAMVSILGLVAANRVYSGVLKEQLTTEVSARAVRMINNSTHKESVLIALANVAVKKGLIQEEEKANYILVLSNALKKKGAQLDNTSTMAAFKRALAEKAVTLNLMEENGQLTLQIALETILNGLKLKKIAIYVALAAAAALVVGAIKAIINAINAEENAIKNANENVTELTTKYEELKSAADSFKQAISDYDSAVNALDGLDKSTKEYADALEEANEKARNLIETYGLFNNYRYENGLIVIDEDALAEAQKLMEAREESAYRQMNSAKIYAEQLSLDKYISQERKDIPLGSINYTYKDEYGDEQIGQRQLYDEELLDLSLAIQEVSDGITLPANELIEKLSEQGEALGLSQIVIDNMSSVITDAAIPGLYALGESAQAAADKNNYYAESLIRSNVGEQYSEEITALATGEKGYDSTLASNLEAAIGTVVANQDNINQTIDATEKIQGIISSYTTNNDAGNSIESGMKTQFSAYLKDQNFEDVYSQMFNGAEVSYDGNINSQEMIKHALLAEGASNIVVVDNKKGGNTVSYTTADGQRVTNEEITNEAGQEMWANQIADYIVSQTIDQLSSETLTEDRATELFGQVLGSPEKYGADWSSAFINAVANPDQDFDFSSIFPELSPSEVEEIKSQITKGNGESLIQELFGLTPNEMAELNIDTTEFLNNFAAGLENYDFDVYKNAANAAGEAEAEALDLDIEEFKAYRDLLAEQNEELKEQPKLLNKIALVHKRYNRGVKEMIDNQEEWNEQIHSGDLEKQSKALAASREAIQDIANMDDDTFEALDPKVLVDNWDLLQEGINGNEEAMNQWETAVFQSLNKTDGAFKGLSDDMISQMNDLVAHAAGLDFSGLTPGASIDDADFNAKLNSMIFSTAEAAQAMSDNLSSMGVDAEVEEHTYTVPATQATKRETGAWTITNMNGPPITVPISATVTESGGEKTFTWYTLKGAKYNGKGVTSGGGSNNKGGGGGGGKAKVPEKKNDTDKTRYHTVTNQLEDLKSEYEEIAEASDRAFGADKLAKMDDEIAKTDELIEKQKEYIDAIDANLPMDKAIMVEYYNEVIGGPEMEFDEKGNISNYDEIQDAMYKAWNEDYYNLSEEEREAWEEKYEKVEKYIEQYEETYDLLRDEEQALQDLINQRLDLLLEEVQYEVELKLNISDDSLQLIEFQLNMLEDNAFKAAEAIEYQTEQAEILYDKMQANEQGLRDILATSDMSVSEIEQLLAGDTSVLDGHTFTEAQIEAIREYRDNLLDLSEELQEVREEVQERLLDAFDEWNEELDKGIEKFDHYNSIMENYKNIIEIVGKEYLKIDNKALGNLDQAMVENNINRVKATKDALDALTDTEIRARQAYEDAVARGNENDIQYWKETLETIGDEVESAEEEMMQAWEDALQAAADAFEATVERAIENFEKALLPFGTLDEFSDAYEKQQEVADQYLDDYQQIYELSKLSRDINNSIDDTKSIAGKQKLKGLLNDINKLQEEGTQLSEYDLEYLQKTYDLRMAEIALEEAQKAKDTVRLTRDNEGNWSYAYTTNTDAADDAAQKYEDALYAMQELSSEYIDEMSEQLISTSQEMEEALAAVRAEDYASIEEYYKKLDEIQSYYLNRMTYMQGEMQKALDNNKALYEQDWQNYAAATGYKISDDNKFAMSYKDTVLGTLFGSESDIVDFQERVNEALGTSDSGLIGELLDAYLQWSQNTDNAMNAAGTSSEDFAEDMDTAVHGEGGIVDSSTAATDAVNDMATQMVAGFDTISSAVERWQSQVGDAADAVIKDYLDVVQAYNLMVSTLSSTSGNAQAESDLEDIVTTSDKEDVASAATGGYTGEWGPEGKFLLAHEKELILNQDDTTNFLTAIKLTREMLNTIDLNAQQASAGFGILRAGVIKDEEQQVLEQQVHITAEFPNVTDHYEVEEALNNLINTSSQYANRK